MNCTHLCSQHCCRAIEDKRRLSLYLSVPVQRCFFERIGYHRPHDLERPPQVGPVWCRSLNGRQLGHVLRPTQHKLDNREMYSVE